MSKAKKETPRNSKFQAVDRDNLVQMAREATSYVIENRSLAQNDLSSTKQETPHSMK
ncbi:hypothetical protein [Beggiatoa leptomitoformis]|uniref:Uncharacterized protein n=1 Tax=Beggiatoa leptomitoformis TaxID=288004 RepID=A0A650GCL2_9GAMM|nr:hypothetical protein [Beggiatoa leptomitoformis]QGX03784.1 hypothetical protein AL038_19330 [Beggiatoa leptomitoformis]QGX04125.1 hypothetical protein BLE401_18715 [Beggiatoa leptomitoformis]